MPRKKRSRSSVAKVTRKRKNPAPRNNASLVGNPPFWQDLYNEFAPAIVGYAATRIAGRVAFKIAKRKSTTFAKHLGPWASVLTAGIGWWAIHRNPEWERKYHSAVIGAFIAAFQGLVQTYVPHYGWILNDYHLDDPSPRQIAAPNGKNGALPEGDGMGQYLEADANDALDDALSDVLNPGEDEGSLYSGIFSS